MTRLQHTFLLVIILGWTAAFAVEIDPARRAWMKGYEAMTHADKSLKTQADLAALHGYEKALNVFQDVKSKYPGWNVSLIDYRIEYCQKKIKEIKEANRQNVAYLSKDDLLAQLAQQANDIQTLKDTITARDREIDKMRQSLERARAEAASLAVSEENFHLMKKDRDTLANQVRSLASQVSDLKEELEHSKTSVRGKKQLDELSAQLKRSQEELSSTARELERIAATRDDLLAQTQRDAKWRKDAEAQLAELRRLAESARRQHEESEAQVLNLQATIKRLETDKNNDNIPADMKQLMAQLKSQTDKLQSTQMELLSAQRKLAQSEDAATRLSQELADERLKTGNIAAAVSEDLDGARKALLENAELKDQNTRMAQTIASQKELLATFENTLSSKEKDLAEYGSKLDEIIAINDKLLARLNLVDSSGKAASGLAENAAELQGELASAQQSIQTLKREREALSKRLNKTEENLKNAAQRLGEVAENAQDAGSRILQDRVDELQQELLEATNRIHDLESALVKRDMANRNLERALTDKEVVENSVDSDSQAIIPDGIGIGQETGKLSATDQVIVKGFLRQGINAEKKGNTETAQWNYHQALSMQPDNFLALKRLGLMASANGNDAEAAQFLSTASKCNPDDTEVLLALGFAQLQLKQSAWALATLSRAAALKPQDQQTARLFGVALGAMEWREAAIVQLQKALELNKQDREAAINLAMIALTRASEIEFEARKDADNRTALERLASSIRHQALEWYRLAVANGAPEDSMLEEALSK